MIELYLLGDPHVAVDGVGVPLQRKPLAVLSYLALNEPGRFVRRDTLLGVFWPDHEQSRARGALRQVLHQLRHELGDDAVRTEGDDDVALNHEHVRCDAFLFERAVRDGQLTTAIDLYGGSLLSGLHLKGCSEFEHWLDGKRAPLAQAYERAVEQLADMARSAQDHARAAEWLRRLVRTDPLRGRFALLLMEELEAAGDREEAIRVGEGHVKSMAHEWGVAPDAMVTDLLDRLRHAPSRAAHPTSASTIPLRCETELVREALHARYDVLEERGGGALAKVFLAWDPKLRRHVALKVLRPEHRTSVEAERFLREIALVAEFNHPNIVPLFEADELGGFLYCAMRHIPGPSVRERLQREGALPIDDAIRITCDVARGLEYAHERRVVHRDVKPKNILLHEGTALIADFGTAIVTKVGGERLTRSGVVVGTPEYMSPEQTIPGGHVDGRSDVYALACVLYEMLVGEPVFTGTWAAVVAKHTHERVPSIRLIRPAVSETLENVVKTALAKTPGDRFQSAAAFGAALEAL